MNAGFNEWQVRLLEQSLTSLAPVGEKVAARFYQSLFQEAPSLVTLFQGISPSLQHKQFWLALTETIRGFQSPDVLTKELQSLGMKHKHYGVRPEEYESVRVTLLKILKEFLLESWSEEMQLAWSLALFEVSQIMLQGARQASTTKPSL